MTCLSYVTPSMINGDWASIKNFVDVMNQNFTNAGLIKTAIPSGTTYTDSYSTKTIVDYNTDTFVATMTPTTITATAVAYNNQYLFSIQYDLPTGDGSIVTQTHPTDSRYKKLISESYDSTQVRLRFDFLWVNCYTGATNTGIGNMLLVIRTNVINPLTGAVYCVRYVGYNIVAGVKQHALSLSYSGSSYISLTGKTLSLAIGRHVLTGSAYVNNNNEYNLHMININIYRNNGNISVYGINGGYNNNDSVKYGYFNSAAWGAIQMHSLDVSTNIVTTQTSSANGGFLMWAYGTLLPSMSGGEVVTGKVYSIQGTNTITQVPQFVITRKMDTNPSIIPLVYKYNNEYILGNFLNFGLSERAICPVVPQSITYSWANLHDSDATYTTSHVGT